MELLDHRLQLHFEKLQTLCVEIRQVTPQKLLPVALLFVFLCLTVMMSCSGPRQRSGQQTERRSREAEEDQGSPWSEALLGVRDLIQSELFDFIHTHPNFAKMTCVVDRTVKRLQLFAC